MERLARALRVVLAVLGGWMAAHLLLRLYRRLFPSPFPPLMSPILQSPLRDLGQPRQATLQHIGLAPGMRVLELGAGVGHYTAAAAHIIGPEGRLSAVDVQPRMVASLADRVRREGLENVEVRLADAKNLP